jgi:catechol-2,3-dioxygenase
MQEIGKSNHNEDEKNEIFEIDPAASIGYVSLNVSDIQRSLDFCQSILAFRQVGKRSPDRALLQSNGASSSHLLELVHVGQRVFCT